MGDEAYIGKKVAIVGSGATAITLLPNMVTGGAAHCTMVQRTPGYILASPAVDRVAKVVQAVLPERFAHSALRLRAASWFVINYNLMKKYPATAKKLLLSEEWKLINGSMS